MSNGAVSSSDFDRERLVDLYRSLGCVLNTHDYPKTISLRAGWETPKSPKHEAQPSQGSLTTLLQHAGQNHSRGGDCNPLLQEAVFGPSSVNRCRTSAVPSGNAVAAMSN